MFGLPTHRTRTVQGERDCADDGITDPTDPRYDPLKDVGAYGCCPTCPKTIKSALRLAEMRWNHFTVVISQDLKNMRTWGSRCTSVGVPNPSANPQRVFPNWVGPKEEIAYVRAQEYWALFRTLQGSIYCTGNNPGGIFNSTYTNTGRFERGITDVKWISIGGSSGGGETTAIYVKNNGRVHGLGAARSSGFGAYTTALLTDGPASNDLGIGDALKCWVQLNVDDVNNTKTFVLKLDGSLWACGYNGNGALGVGDPAGTHVTTWKQVIDSAGNPLKNVKEVVSSSRLNTTCILADGKVYSCGTNTNGGLGRGLGAGAETNVATEIPNISNANLLAGGFYYSSFIASTLANEVYTWGRNANGECGIGVTGVVNTATKVPTIPNDEKVVFVHGGGNYGVIDGAFVVVRERGSVYVAGMNKSYALGVPAYNGQDITTFVRNDYFGFGSPRLIEPWRFPINVPNNNFSAGSVVLSGSVPIDYEDKNVTPPGLATRLERVYVNPEYYVSGPGIKHGTMVTFVDRVNNRIHIDTPTQASGTNVTLTYINYPKAIQADLCGYQGSQRELSMKVVSKDGTLYQCGWNQLVGGLYNFNPRVGTERVDIPTAFEADF